MFHAVCQQSLYAELLFHKAEEISLGLTIVTALFPLGLGLWETFVKRGTELTEHGGYLNVSEGKQSSTAMIFH